MLNPYDQIAEIYDAGWDGWYWSKAKMAISRLFFDVVPRGSLVLDACCGCGHVTQHVAAEGYRVVGIDASEALIRIARQRVPDARLAVQDVRSLGVRGQFDAALCTFDALNHLLIEDDVISALRCIHDALRPGGRFVCDINTEAAFQLDRGEWASTVFPNAVSVTRSTYDAESKLGTTEILQLDRNLRRRTGASVVERSYQPEEFLRFLSEAGFVDAVAYDGAACGALKPLSVGRCFFTASA